MKLIFHIRAGCPAGIDAIFDKKQDIKRTNKGLFVHIHTYKN